MKREDDYFPSDLVDTVAFNKCFPKFSRICEISVLDNMGKNELALKISSEYYNEKFSKRVIDLAEQIYSKVNGSIESATIPQKDNTRRMPEESHTGNPFKRYRI